MSSSYWEGPRWRRSQPSDASNLYDTDAGFENWATNPRSRRSYQIEDDGYYGSFSEPLWNFPRDRRGQPADMEGFYDVAAYEPSWQLSRRRRAQPIDIDLYENPAWNYQF
ncbi:unnamed protein product, partial [Mesorhabditis spiculigera]